MEVIIGESCPSVTQWLGVFTYGGWSTLSAGPELGNDDKRFCGKLGSFGSCGRTKFGSDVNCDNWGKFLITFSDTK